MRPAFCEQEATLLDIILSGRWPDGCDGELRAHVAQCDVCADVALVAQTIQDDKHSAGAENTPPPAGLVWWKAQLKARREALKRASEPISLVERAAGIFGLAALVVLLIWQWASVRAWFSWPSQNPGADAAQSSGLSSLAGILFGPQSFVFLIIASAVFCLALASIVVYYLFVEE